MSAVARAVTRAAAWSSPGGVDADEVAIDHRQHERRCRRRRFRPRSTQLKAASSMRNRRATVAVDGVAVVAAFGVERSPSPHTAAHSPWSHVGSRTHARQPSNGRCSRRRSPRCPPRRHRRRPSARRHRPPPGTRSPSSPQVALQPAGFEAHRRTARARARAVAADRHAERARDRARPALFRAQRRCSHRRRPCCRRRTARRRRPRRRRRSPSRRTALPASGQAKFASSWQVAVQPSSHRRCRRRTVSSPICRPSPQMAASSHAAPGWGTHSPARRRDSWRNSRRRRRFRRRRTARRRSARRRRRRAAEGLRRGFLVELGGRVDFRSNDAACLRQHLRRPRQRSGRSRRRPSLPRGSLPACRCCSRGAPASGARSVLAETRSRAPRPSDREEISHGVFRNGEIRAASAALRLELRRRSRCGNDNRKVIALPTSSAPHLRCSRDPAPRIAASNRHDGGHSAAPLVEAAHHQPPIDGRGGPTPAIGRSQIVPYAAQSNRRQHGANSRNSSRQAPALTRGGSG